MFVRTHRIPLRNLPIKRKSAQLDEQWVMKKLAKNLGNRVQVFITNSCLLSSSVASSVSCAKRSVRNFSSS